MNSQLHSAVTSFAVVTDCVKYSSAGKCFECGNQSRYLLTANNTCSPVCANDTSAIVLDNLDGRVNICVTRTLMKTMTGAGMLAADDAV